VDEVMDLARRSRTRELPGNYPFVVKHTLISEFLATWNTLSAECSEDVRGLLVAHVTDLIDVHFNNQISGGLRDIVATVVSQQIRHRFEATSEKLSALYTSELTPYTQNEDYFFSERSKFMNLFKTLYRRSDDQGNLVTALDQYDNPPTIMAQASDTPSKVVYTAAPTMAPTMASPMASPMASTASPMREHVYIPPPNHLGTALSALKSFGIHGLTATDLSKLLPEDKMAPGLEIMAEVRAYFQVAYKRFTDDVPKQIDSHFIQGLDRQVRLVLGLISMDASHDQCTEWLREDLETVRQREDLMGKKKRLESAKEKLGSVVRASKIAHNSTE